MTNVVCATFYNFKQSYLEILDIHIYNQMTNVMCATFYNFKQGYLHAQCASVA